MAVRNWKDIPLFKDVTEEQWNDWHWQVENRLTTVEDICQVVNLTEEEKEEIEKVIGGFRVGITPYYASIMDPDDPRCPVRMQA
ncbi:MAG: lysine 2,3-aminomutase, partial [Firmicutes bacterium]|nr:lysine 2,3-aminomutase [Bacillota bacterium]